MSDKAAYKYLNELMVYQTACRAEWDMTLVEKP